MITATSQPPFDEVAAALAEMTRTIAEAQARQTGANAQTSWRQADLLWPLFTASPTQKGRM